MKHYVLCSINHLLYNFFVGLTCLLSLIGFVGHLTSGKLLNNNAPHTQRKQLFRTLHFVTLKLLERLIGTLKNWKSTFSDKYLWRWKMELRVSWKTGDTCERCVVIVYWVFCVTRACNALWASVWIQYGGLKRVLFPECIILLHQRLVWPSDITRCQLHVWRQRLPTALFSVSCDRNVPNFLCSW